VFLFFLFFLKKKELNNVVVAKFPINNMFPSTYVDLA